MSSEQSPQQKYYVPDSSIWPLVGAVALGLIAFGAAHYTIEWSNQQAGFGHWVLLAGIVVLIVMLVGWFRDQIRESQQGLYNAQLGRSYRQGMSWFIFSEVMFFLVLFGALFYARIIAVPWLGGTSSAHNVTTSEVLWPAFEAVWPLTTTPDGTETQAMGWFGLPLVNTIILITSSVTLHFAHHGLEHGKRGALKVWLGLTILLGLIFLSLQMYEYVHAYRDLGLTMQSGIYGNTFFLLTGFHGVHVTLGAIMLIVMFARVFKGHFTKDKQFAFEASVWYWHFVDVVWVLLFIFVYII